MDSDEEDQDGAIATVTDMQEDLTLLYDLKAQYRAIRRGREFYVSTYLKDDSLLPYWNDALSVLKRLKSIDLKATHNVLNTSLERGVKRMTHDLFNAAKYGLIDSETKFLFRQKWHILEEWSATCRERCGVSKRGMDPWSVCI